MRACTQVPAVASIDWDAWYFKPGMPPATNTYDTSLGAAALELARKWHTCDVMGLGSEWQGRGGG